MLQNGLLFGVSALYVGLLFGIAYYGDRAAARRQRAGVHPWVYSLALGVYCTSWTFYGAVGRAADSGWDFLPIYLGPICVFIFGIPLLRRIIQVSKRNNITSIADFIGARYGRHQSLAMLVAIIAIVGVLPYIALQLKAVAFSFQVLTHSGSDVAPSTFDNALLIALMLAVFTILFGTRHVASSESHHGMVLAIAFESVIKLIAFLAIGLYVCYSFYDGLGDAYAHALALPQVAETPTQPAWQLGFLTQTLLAAAAIICLPRQFHVTVVESADGSELRTARWLFPLYLALISLFVLPIAVAGIESFDAARTHADTFVLALPMAQGNTALALFAYLGGFSAATSMVIVATIALSTMLCNEVVMPLLLRSRRLGLERRSDLSGLLKLIRRIAIVAIIMLAYVYYRLFTGPGTLTSIGLLSFAAVLQFAPALIGGIYWRSATRQAAMTGMIAGFSVWTYTLLLPNLLPPSLAASWLSQGPLGLQWLRPEALFGLDMGDPLTHGALFSLGANLFCFVAISLLRAQGLRERLQLARFLGDAPAPVSEQVPLRSTATVGDLQELLERFFGTMRAKAIFAEYAQRSGMPPFDSNARADSGLARHTEHLLAGMLGAASARLVLASALRGRDMQLEDVIQLLDETSHAIQFNRELLRATLEHLSQGVSVVDQNLRLVAWNRRYLELFDYPAGQVYVGLPIEELVRYNARRGLLGSGDAEQQVARRLQHMREGHAYTHQREFNSGMVLEIRGNPMPGGGFVTTYADITEYKRAERQLQEMNETLESRVQLRTQELTQVNLALQDAKAGADRANEAKTRFLAAASHDLVQPLNAARLFVGSIARKELPAAADALIAQVEQSLGSAENLIAGLLDISRLDAQAQEVKLEHFAAEKLLLPLAAEFELIARAHGLQFSWVRSSAVLYSDPRLLRRILQNFLSNAVRYTARGRIVFGGRRTAAGLRIEVWDQGPGIAEGRQREIFEEFRRLQVRDAHGERGLGLGLAIAERIAQVLGHPLALRSWPERGSVFSVTVPWGQAHLSQRVPVPSVPAQGLGQMTARVLCLENEPAVVEGMKALLGGWACEVMPAHDLSAARALYAQNGSVPDLVLADYHLDEGANGIAAVQALQALWGLRVPVIVITADATERIAREAEAQSYMLLPKPIKPAALRALMSRLLLTRGEPRE